jgi:uncharacterized protein (TIGR02271 family)
MEDFMAHQTVIALYDEAQSARQVLAELTTASFPDSHFWLSGSGEDTARQPGLADFARSFSTPSSRVEALRSRGVPERDAHTYAEGVRRGGTLLIGSIPDDVTDRALDIIERYAPVDMEERSHRYTSSGWSRYDAAGTDYTSDQVTSERSRWSSSPAGTITPGMGTDSLAAGSNLGAGQSSDYSRATRTETTTGSTVPGLGTDTNRAAASSTGSYQSTGTTGFGSSSTETNRMGTTSERVSTGQEQAIPIIEEQIDISKRRVNQGSVRVRTYMVERPVEEQVTLRQETINVERRVVDRPVNAGDIPADALRDRTIEVTATDEQAIVNKSARVVEEVVISKDVQERTETVRDTVHRTEVEVEDTRGLAAGTTAAGMSERARVHAQDVQSGLTNNTTGRDDRTLVEKAKDALTPGSRDPNRDRDRNPV